MGGGRRGPQSATQVIPSTCGVVLVPPFTPASVGGVPSQGHGRRPAVPPFSPGHRRGRHTSPGSAPGLGKEGRLCAAPTEVTEGHRPCALGEESQTWCFVAAPDQEVASALPHPETFPPDEITSPAGEQAPIVKGWGLERKGVFQALKNSSPGMYESAWSRVAHPPPAAAQALSRPSPHRDLVVTSWRIH